MYGQPLHNRGQHGPLGCNGQGQQLTETGWFLLIVEAVDELEAISDRILRATHMDTKARVIAKLNGMSLFDEAQNIT